MDGVLEPIVLHPLLSRLMVFFVLKQAEFAQSLLERLISAYVFLDHHLLRELVGYAVACRFAHLPDWLGRKLSV